MKAILAAALFLLAIPAAAAEPPKADKYPSIEAVPKVLLADLRRGQSYREQYVSNMTQALQFGRNGKAPAITRQDIDRLTAQIELEARRTRYLEVVFYDLDFDGTVTQQEVGSVMMDERRQQQRSVEGCTDDAARFVGRYDSDKDGQISLKEMSTPDSARKGRDQAVRRMNALLLLDPDHDGKLTAAELEGLARKAFATIDTDGDGTLSNDESQAARDTIEDY